MIETKTNLWDWLERPPTIVIYRPDGQLSLDILPNMQSPDSVICFSSLEEAWDFLGQTSGKSRSTTKQTKLKGFYPVRMPFEAWVKTVQNEAKRGRTHLSIFHLPGDGSVEKTGVRIDDVLEAFEFAAKEIASAQINEGQNDDYWRWN